MSVNSIIVMEFHVNREDRDALLQAGLYRAPEGYDVDIIIHVCSLWHCQCCRTMALFFFSNSSSLSSLSLCCFNEFVFGYGLVFWPHRQ